MDSRRGVPRALTPGTLSFSFDDYRTSDRESLAGSTAPVDDEVESRSSPSPVAASLPTEVILQILYFTDPETFASLVLINRTWRKAAEHYQVYAYQLARCPSYAGSRTRPWSPSQERDLPKLKRQLGQEAKRNLFAAFLRPQQTVLNLISTTTSSSAAFPYGEGFEFSFSPRAQHSLAISSSRIIVLNTASPTPHVTRELKVVRRPIAACILADGSLLAVLAANHRVHLYDLTHDHVMFKRSLELNETAHTITMTSGGEILAAGCEGGVEVVSLAENTPQPAKRVIKCDRVDHLAFSADGTMLLGTTQAARTPNTVILTAPYFTDFSEHEMERAELLSHLWTSQIIFPNSSRDCSHAALLPRNQEDDANWTLAYDRVFESFRAVRTDDLRNGTTYFTGPDADQASSRHLELEQRQREQEQERTRRSKTSFTPRTLPAITTEGELVAAAFLTSDIWLYGVPEDLEHSGTKFRAPRQNSVAGNTPSPRNSLRDVDRLPRWQLLVDKYRNVFAKGRKVASVTGASNLCWCTPDPDAVDARTGYDRLVIAAPGGVSDTSDLPDADLASVDGGRLVLLDFHLGSIGSEMTELTIEVGTAEPELLEEEDMDMEEEIAVVRRRTLARQEGASRLTVSSVADVLRPVTIGGAPPVPPLPDSVGFGFDRTSTEDTPAVQVEPSEPDGPEIGLDGLDGPYSQSGPRSRETVYRSAAAVEASRRRNPPGRQTDGPAEFRRTDGTELPHESDADNWVPPPPAYGEHVIDDRPHHDARRSIASQEARRSSPEARRSAASPEARRSVASQDVRRSVISQEARRSIASHEGRGPAETANPTDNAESAQAAPLEKRLSAVSQLSPITVRQSLISQISSASSGTRPLHLTQPSPNAPLVSPMSLPSPKVLPRRSVGTSDQSQQTMEVRRRSTADIEGTRWFSRHEENRSMSPALAEEESLQRSQSQRSSPTLTSPNALRRPASSYTPRSAIYRAALQPPPAIGTIPEPGASRERTPRVRISPARDSPPNNLAAPIFYARLDWPLPSPPGPDQLAAVANRDRSVSPMRNEDMNGSFTAREPSPELQPRIVPRTRSVPPPSSSQSRPPPEPSAWAANAMSLSAARRSMTPPPREPQIQPSRKSQRVLGLGRFGTPPEPQNPISTATDTGHISPVPRRASTHSYFNTPDVSRSPSRASSLRRRSLRFLHRPKTVDPAVLAANAPSIPPVPQIPPNPSGITAHDMVASVNAAAAPPTRAMTRNHKQTQSMVEPPSISVTHRRGWERTPEGHLPISPVYEQAVHIQSSTAPSAQRRVRMFPRIPPGVQGDLRTRGSRVEPGAEKKGRERRCIVM